MKLPIAVDTQVIWEDYSLWGFWVSWEVFPAQESTIVSKALSTVKMIYVKIWDKVKKWDKLVNLSSNAIEIAYSNAKTNYDNAKNTLNRTISSSNKTLNNVEISLNNARITYENTKKQIELQKNQALQNFSSTKLSTALSINQAKQNLDNLYSTTSKNESLARTNLNNSLSGAKNVIYDILSGIDEILWIEEIHKEWAFIYQSYLWNLNPSTLNNAKNAYRNAKHSVDTTNFQNSDKVLETLLLLSDSVFANLELLKHSSTGPNFTSSSLSSLIDSANTLSSTVQASITSISSAKKTLDATLASNQASIDASRKALELTEQQNWNDNQAIIWAKSAYDVTLTNLENTLESVKNNLALAESAYESSLASSRLQVAQARSQFDIIKWQYESIKVNYDDLSIISWFNWEISNIYIALWNEIPAWKPIIELSNSDSNFKIVTFLTKNQIKWINVWDKVRIWNESEDYISSISSSADQNTRKYKIEISHKNLFLKLWQFVNLYFTPAKIISDEKIEEKIFLPLSAVFVSSELNFVWVIDNNWIIKKFAVELWEISWTLIEITAWLKVWNSVIIKWWRNLKEGDEVSVRWGYTTSLSN